jgi:hypothetical protein
VSIDVIQANFRAEGTLRLSNSMKPSQKNHYLGRHVQIQSGNNWRLRKIIHEYMMMTSSAGQGLPRPLLA